MNAIIMAAGIGERLKPLTIDTPKPLLKVKGVPMIENIISFLKLNGISEIYIVVGYKKEQFEYLTKKYNVNLIDNPDYNKANNIASLYYAREHIGETLILDGDQIINNLDISVFNSYSGYVCIKKQDDGYLNEWMLTLDNNHKIINCKRNGGNTGFILKSFSFWNKNDSFKLRKYLEIEYIINKNTNIYWDDVAMFVHKNEFELYGYIINQNNLIEIDTLEEYLEINKE